MSYSFIPRKTAYTSLAAGTAIGFAIPSFLPSTSVGIASEATTVFTSSSLPWSGEVESFGTVVLISAAERIGFRPRSSDSSSDERIATFLLFFKVVSASSLILPSSSLPLSGKGGKRRAVGKPNYLNNRIWRIMGIPHLFSIDFKSCCSVGESAGAPIEIRSPISPSRW